MFEICCSLEAHAKAVAIRGGLLQCASSALIASGIRSSSRRNRRGCICRPAGGHTDRKHGICIACFFKHQFGEPAREILLRGLSA